MGYDFIRFEQNGSLAKIILNRPQVLNALNYDVMSELEDVIQEINKDRSIRVVLIYGEGGRAFAAGADILGMKDKSPLGIKPQVETGMRAFHMLESMPAVSIALINGYALGGGLELALACDLRIAASNAKLGLPETGLGIIPGSGGTQRLTRLIGAAKAKELIFLGEQIGAQEAMRIGLVNQICEPDELLTRGVELADKILKKGPIAIRAAKDAIFTGAQADIETALKYEMNIFTQLFATEDQKEGMTAFAEKRTPIYRDK